ncbi:hypothetical protein [Pelosinus baikalensis]|uniref:Uncharacterized protein n=1 Tax=Pelosinus baikalensis TaxID=2892015 RepID=A0ABS8HRP5_9FIRM|nr:hypothetical protein [Pelosinus baikalensis]MCC5464918.1 hypothetical protein [Pelosinus baikalensis]
MYKKRECKVQNEVQIICPYCGLMIELPMCKVINSEEITCEHCQNKFKFKM